MGTANPCSGSRPSIEEQLARQFYTWELRGRGWQLYSVPVDPEPLFEPFFGFHLDDRNISDDGRKPTILSGVFEWFHHKLRRHNNKVIEPTEEEPQRNEWDDPGELSELRLTLPQGMDVSRSMSEQLLLSLSSCRHPPAFEILGTPGAIHVQFACAGKDADNFHRQIESHFPEAGIRRDDGFLEGRWNEGGEGDSVIAELGLSREFMLPLASSRNFDVDIFTGVAGVLSGVEPDEVALLQIIFRPVRHSWAQSVLRSVMFADGTPLFTGFRDFLKQAETKIARPLYGVVARVACKSEDHDRSVELAKQIIGSVSPLNDPEGNELIPLDNDEYDAAEHELDLLHRRSRRSGMILNSSELVSLVHLPTASVQNPKLRQQGKPTKAAPMLVQKGNVLLGHNEHAGDVLPVRLTPDQRSKHIHVIGASGTGKSTLLLNLIIQDIANGDGVAVLDPHGDLIDAVLPHIPPERIKDVVLFDPADEQFPVGFNILSAHSELEKNLLSSDLVAVFRRLSTSWGDQMNGVLGNAIIAFLESTRGGTLVDLRRFLVEPAFRKEFLSSVQDEEIVYYWTKQFPLLTGKPQSPVLTRLDAFLRPKLIRHMVGQKTNRLDFADVMDNQRIFLARLSHGAIGEENAHLLGTMLVAKLHQVALGRQRMAESQRRYFWLYIDEFQNFATPSMAAILTGARKYRMGLVLAHQELHQLASKVPDVASAVMSNAYTRICFRLGDDDARKLAGGLGSFEAIDLQNLTTGEAICRVERAELDFNLRTSPLKEVDETVAIDLRNRVVAASRQKYAIPREEVEAELSRSRVETEKAEPEPSRKQEPPSPATKAPPVPNEPLEPVQIEPKAQTSPRKIIKPPPPEPAQQGRGGPEHRYIQHLIKQYAEGLGFKAGIEENVLGGRAVDVALVKGDTSIACEICITTDEEHELGNVQKCLEAGYKHVAVISPNANRLKSLEKAIGSKLAEHQRPRVGFFAPEEVLRFIQELEVHQLSQERTMRGYKIKTTIKAVDEDENKSRRVAVSQVIAQAMKRVTKSKK